MAPGVEKLFFVLKPRQELQDEVCGNPVVGVKHRQNTRDVTHQHLPLANDDPCAYLAQVFPAPCVCLARQINYHLEPPLWVGHSGDL